MKKGNVVISVKGLTKKFGNFAALDEFNLEVKKGEVHGFLGPNGAGKSTTIRVLLGLLKKTSGDVTMLGKDPWADAVELHKSIAYVPGEVNLWPNLSGGEAIDLIASLRGGIDRKRRDELTEAFKFNPKKKFRAYSKGNRQKVAIIAALASDVDVYILDEPTSGLDPLMESVFQHYVDKLKKKGKTILLSSHILAEVEKLCDRITIIRNGKTIQSGTLSEMRHLTNTTITVDTKQPVVGLSKVAAIHNANIEKNHTKFEVAGKDLDKVLKHLTKFGIQSITSHPPTLEEMFMSHYNEDPNLEQEQEANKKES
ncbi:ABC transporter ATP-binding protein [Candidatus Saccharibacteria bacterium]|nr:ABC transporter ATP-binding protein [Candidatus Saccharibacteria bacterium]